MVVSFVEVVAVVPECELLAVIGLVAVVVISSPSTRECQQKFDDVYKLVLMFQKKQCQLMDLQKPCEVKTYFLDFSALSDFAIFVQ